MPKSLAISNPINSLQTGCIVKGEAQKSPLFGRYSVFVYFFQERLFSRTSTRNPLKSPITTNTLCKSTYLYNAPSLDTVYPTSNLESQRFELAAISAAISTLSFN